MIKINFKPSKKQYEAWQYLMDKDTLYVGYGGAAFCFVADTLVNTNKGYKPIQDIKVGDFVLSENLISNNLEFRKVEKTYKNSSEIERKFIKFTFINGKEIKSTFNHEYKFNNEYKTALSICFNLVDKNKLNDWLKGNEKDFYINNIKINKSIDNSIKEINLNDIVRIDFTTEYIETYDLKVEFNENYIVSENNIKVHNSGKSYMLCYWLTTMCIAYPDTAWGLGRRELVNLKKTTLVTLFKVFSECGIEKEVHYKYNQQDNIITFFNGSVIYLIDTANKPSDPLFTRFGGLELTGAAIDESAETDYEAVKILFTRLGRRNNEKYGIKKKLLETFNPSKNHVYARYYKPHKANNELPFHKFVPALPKDNPAPEVDDYIKDILATSDEVTIQRLIYGNFEYDDDPSTMIQTNAIYNLFNVNKVEEGIKAITCDVARFGKDASIIMLWNGYNVEKIYKYDKNSLPELANEIKGIAKANRVNYENIVIDESGVGGGCVDLIPDCYGFISNARALNDENYNNLKSQCYYKLAEKINSNEINIKDEQYKTQIIEELEQVKRKNMDADGKMQVVPKDEVKKILGRSPDFSDTLMMRMVLDLRVVHKLTGSMALYFGL